MSHNTDLFNQKCKTLVSLAPTVKLEFKSEMLFIEKFIALLRDVIGEPVVTGGILYCYLPETGTFIEVDRSVLRGIIQEFSKVRFKKTLGRGDQQKTFWATWNYSVSIARSLTSGILNSLDVLREDTYFGNATPGINFRNCFLKVSGEAVEALEHSPEFRVRNGYDIDYSPDGKKPTRYLEFLKETFLNDSDQQEKIALLQEYLGCCIIGVAAIKGQKALLAIGSGANGKSAVQYSWRVVMPPGSVVTVPPSEFSDPNAVKRLDGALLNISEELPTKRSRAEDVLKAAIAGGFVLGKKQYENKCDFRAVAGHFFGANSWPDVTDQTEGFRRRFIPITFNRSFVGIDAEHRKPWNTLVEIFTEEREAIVSWAIEGAQRFLANGNAFTELPGHSELMKEWMSHAHHVAHWLEDENEVLRGEYAPPDADQEWYRKNWDSVAKLHDEYLGWCDEMKITNKLNRISFGRKLTELGIGKTVVGSTSRRQLRVTPKSKKIASIYNIK